MKMSELILAVGDDNIAIQNLDQCAIAFDYNIKSGTKIRFGTEEPFDGSGTKRLGIVVWLPREAVKAAIDAEKKAKADA